MYTSAPRSTAFSPTPIQTTGPRPYGSGRVVREDESRYDAGQDITQYEAEGTELRSLGSVSVAGDAHWTATLTIPLPERSVAFLELERCGDVPAGYVGSGETTDLSLPMTELDALVTLLVGIVGQARQDGLLPPL